MFSVGRREFIKELLTDCSSDTAKALIINFDLPKLLERTLIDIYVEGLEIKEIAYKYTIDDRTVKRHHAKALDLAAYVTISRLRMSHKCPYTAIVKE